MIITFATQKGGAGKTTLAILLANYISIEKKKKVNVFDFDFQKSFYHKWKEDEILNIPKLYDVYPLEDDTDIFSDFNKIVEMQNSEDVFLFDLAGTLDKKYANLLMHSNFLIIPFEYSDVSIKSTMMFINFLNMIESESIKIFIRTRYDKGYNYLNQLEMDAIISQYGKLIETPMYKRNGLQTMSTRGLDYNLKKDVKQPLNEIIDYINEKQEITI